MEPQFIQGAKGRLFLMYRRPESTVGGTVLFVPPFAEELNKSRRMLAMAARSLNDKGYATVLPDLYGTGDSDGDFGDADWDGWLDDLNMTLQWIRERHTEPLHVLAMRTGALLASGLMIERELRPQSLVLWNPVVQGKQALTQFLRLSVAGNLTGGGGETTGELRERLTAGESLEIAGYTLSPGLAQGLEAATLTLNENTKPERLVWLEVSSRDEPALSPASERVLAAWREAGGAVEAEALAGDAFWGTTELVDAPALISATAAVYACPVTQAH